MLSKFKHFVKIILIFSFYTFAAWYTCGLDVGRRPIDTPKTRYTYKAVPPASLRSLIVSGRVRSR